MANLEFKRALNFMGFVATMCIAVALVISLIISLFGGTGGIPGFQITNVMTAFTFIANVLAYFITIVAGFYYARSKRSVWFTVAQVIGTILILVAVITGAVL
ncbi:MAG: hypothetical protein IJ301_00125 [Clostridia bacterium]|nr:hypothetical protein [Clostridia bacterium]